MNGNDPVPLIGLLAGIGAAGAAGAVAVGRMRRRNAAPAEPPLDQLIAERTVRRARLRETSEPGAAGVDRARDLRGPTG